MPAIIAESLAKHVGPEIRAVDGIDTLGVQITRRHDDALSGRKK